MMQLFWNLTLGVLSSRGSEIYQNNQPPLNHESKHSTYLVLVLAVENILVSALALISPLSPLEVLEGKQSDTAQSAKIPNATQGKKSNIFSHKWQLQILRIQLKLNTALLSHCPSVSPCVRHRRDISHLLHI